MRDKLIDLIVIFVLCGLYIALGDIVLSYFGFSSYLIVNLMFGVFSFTVFLVITLSLIWLYFKYKV